MNDDRNSIGNSRANQQNTIKSDKQPVCFNHTIIKFIPVTEIKATTKLQRISINKTNNEFNPKIPSNKSSESTKLTTTSKPNAIVPNKITNKTTTKTTTRNKSYGKPVLSPFSTTSKQITLLRVSTTSKLTIYNSSISKLQTPANDVLYKTIVLILIILILIFLVIIAITQKKSGKKVVNRDIEMSSFPMPKESQPVYQNTTSLGKAKQSSRGKSKRIKNSSECIEEAITKI